VIEYHQGSLFDSGADALVNTINCFGVMGAGLALQFKLRYPQMLECYRTACHRRTIQIGKMWLWPPGHRPGQGSPLIIGFPTKFNWKYPSKVEYLEAGLADLVKSIDDWKIASIAIPPLGCGMGGLPWNDVRPLIENTLSDSVARVMLYPPAVI
jgi:O-acetyl-ADP-ribose deacetylase (regulator of RNase III)